MAAKAFRHNGFANFSGPPRANFSPCIGLSKNTDMKRNWDEDGVDISDDDAPICARVGAVKVEPHRGSKKKCSSKIVPPPSIPSPRPPVPDVSNLSNGLMFAPFNPGMAVGKRSQLMGTHFHNFFAMGASPQVLGASEFISVRDELFQPIIPPLGGLAFPTSSESPRLPLTQIIPKQARSLEDIIPDNPYLDASDVWMEKYAHDVKSCPGYGVDKKVVLSHLHPLTMNP